MNFQMFSSRVASSTFRRRYIRECTLGLQLLYRTDEGARNLVRSTMALELLPVEQVVDQFDSLQEEQAAQWGLFIKMASSCENQRWGTLADPRPGPGHGEEWIDCVGSTSASPRLVDDHLFLSKSVPVIPRYGHQMYSVFLWETWLEKQAETTKAYLSSELGMSRSITDHRSRSWVRASFLYMHCEPQELFFVVVSVVLHFTSFPFSFSFFLFLRHSSVAQTVKNVGPLDCNLRLLRRRSLGSKISDAEVMQAVDFERFSVLSCGFSGCCYFLFSFFFIHFLSYFLFPFFFSVVTSNFFFFE